MVFLTTETQRELELRREEARMKRLKRDRNSRAHQRGYQAALAGHSREMCPYQSVDARSQWLGGWREAISQRQEGLFPLYPGR